MSEPLCLTGMPQATPNGNSREIRFILTALVERAGEVVGKEELIARAWPKTFVEEANLKIQVSALRRALGDGQGDNRYVATVVGRGYNTANLIAAKRLLDELGTPDHD